MAAEELKTFEDIYTAICNELRVPLTDTDTLARIKRDINMIYLHEIIPYKQRKWDWLEVHQTITTPVMLEGQITVTHGSDLVTLTPIPSQDLTGYNIKIDGKPEVLEIEEHDFGGTGDIVLNIGWPFESGTFGFKAWKDEVTLPVVVSELIAITHNKRNSPLDFVNNSKFNEMKSRFPDIQQPPEVATVNNRTLRWYPSCNPIPYVMNIEARAYAVALDADSDEPLIPLEDRIVLFYGAASRAWSRERNEGEAARNWNLFMRKINQMAARSSSASDVTEIKADDRYLRNKRYRRQMRRGSNSRGFRID